MLKALSIKLVELMPANIALAVATAKEIWVAKQASRSLTEGIAQAIWPPPRQHPNFNSPLVQ